MTSPSLENEKEEKPVRAMSKFTIDHILNSAGSYPSAEERSFGNTNEVLFPWLHCTRYCPPKIPRNLKREVPVKRQLGRHPRIPFTSQQLSILEEKFRKSPYLSSSEVTKISSSLELSDMRVKIWFQNRRARERREKSQLEIEQKFQIPNSDKTVASPSQSSSAEVLEEKLDSRSTMFSSVYASASTLPIHLQDFPALVPNIMQSVVPVFNISNSTIVTTANYCS